MSRVPTRRSGPESAASSITLPAEPASAARARQFVRESLARSAHRDLEDAAVLCVTELVANVSVHTRASTCDVIVVDRPDQVIIEVHDDTTEVPDLLPADPDEEHGRGLRIVDALAGDWGVTVYPDNGKCVWLRLKSA